LTLSFPSAGTEPAPANIRGWGNEKREEKKKEKKRGGRKREGEGRGEGEEEFGIFSLALKACLLYIFNDFRSYFLVVMTRGTFMVKL
jgi:hypothetical protein